VGRLQITVEVELRAPPGRIGREQVGGHEALPDPGHDVAIGLVDGVEVRLLVDVLLHDPQVGQRHRHLLEDGPVTDQVVPLGFQRGQERRDRLAEAAAQPGPAVVRRLREGDRVGEPVVGVGQVVELVGEADVVGRAQAEHHIVADQELGEVERQRSLGHGAHQQLEVGGVGRVGEEAVRAAPEAPALELRLDTDELAGEEVNGSSSATSKPTR